MSLFGKREKEELATLKASLPSEQLTLAEIKQQIAQKEQELESLIAAITNKQRQLATLQHDIIETDERVMLQSFGMYTPHYYYAVSDEYKKELKRIREEQKQCIKQSEAVSGDKDWTVDGSKKLGSQMVSDMQKLLLRAFNAECDEAIEHVKFNNIASCEKKIISCAEEVSKLGTIMNISINPFYLDLKLDELYLMHEYQQKKQEEKEALRELKEQQREEAKAAKELEEAKKKLAKEQTHFQIALTKLEKQIQQSTGEELQTLLNKQEEMTNQLEDINLQISNVDYRSTNQKAGYVYVISNIGSFGNNVYKIGMTRRLDPMERIAELSSASVPFNFDVHAMIFTEDAPALEAKLHQAFENQKLNYVNLRKEFFAVTLDEIKEVILNNFDKTVGFTDDAPAEQYRISQKIKLENIEKDFRSSNFSVDA